MPGAAATTPKPKRKRKVKLRIRRSPPQESEKRLLRELLNHADEKQIGALYNWAAGTRYHRKSGEQLLEATVAVCERRIGTDMTLQQLPRDFEPSLVFDWIADQEEEVPPFNVVTKMIFYKEVGKTRALEPGSGATSKKTRALSP